MIVVSYSVECAWFPRTMSPAEVGDGFLRAVRAIGGLDAKVANWRLFEPDDPTGPGLPIDLIADDFARYAQANGERDEDGGLRLIASCELGDQGGSEDRQALNARTGSLLAVDGSEWRNYANFVVGSKHWPASPSVVTYPLFRGVLLTMLNVWQPPWACVRCPGPTGNTAADSGDPTFPYSYFQVPWMGYLDAARAGAAVMPPGLTTERTPDGGLLMTAAQTRPDFDDSAVLGRAKQIAQIMMTCRRKDDPVI
jgi:hypothetical protein